MSDTPPFVLLSQKLPADILALKLLGRIVETPKQPTNGYRPEDSRPLLAQEPIEVTDTDATIFYSAITDSAASARLGHLLGLGASSSAAVATRLEGKKIVTRILPQHRDAFDAVAAAHGPALQRLLKLNEGAGYMIVGIKTVVDGAIEVERTRGISTEGQVALPVGAAVTAATQGAVVPGTNLDPRVVASRGTATQWTARNQIEGEQVFAISYRKVMLEKEGRFWTGKKTVQLKAMHVVDFRDGVFGDGDDTPNQKKDVVYEDDESDDGADDAEDMEGWAFSLSDATATDFGLPVLLS